MIRLRFSKRATITSGLIRVFTWSDYSHVEFELEDGYLGAGDDGGVRLRPLDYDKTGEFQAGYVITPDKETDDKIIAFAKSQIGKPYDWSGVFGIAVHRDWHAKDSWFCSELVAASFDYAAFPIIRSQVNRVTPGMIYESERVQIA